MIPISASPVASFGPTAFSSSTRWPASSYRVSPATNALFSFDADEERVERLVTLVDLDLDVGMV